MNSFHIFFIILFAALTKAAEMGDKDPAHWKKVASDELEEALHLKQIVGVASNVILFLGDGMGIPTVSTARILNGQMQNKSGEETFLSFDKFPHVALSKTYSVDHQTADSAGTAAAFLCGIKTNSGLICQNAFTQPKNCSTEKGNEGTSILRSSITEGKSGGVVTTTRVTHATPANAYAHSAWRNWEADSKMNHTDIQAGCKDIALQLIEDNSDIQVIMGGGRMFFSPCNATDPGKANNSKSTQKDNGRLDNKDLIQAWKTKMESEKKAHKYVWNYTQFQDVDPMKTDYLFGLFNQDHMMYEVERKQNKGVEPSLAEMTEKAIRILRRNPKGYFLLVEGGRIDHGHHAGHASLALHDAVAFHDAVAKAVELTDVEDTLIVVTADHSHTLMFSGYPSRGNNILGIMDNRLDKNNLTYSTLLYGNGPGYENKMKNVSNVNTTDNSYKQPAAIPLESESHGGEDVAIYARGPMSHLFHGVHEQNYIAHVMEFATCVGDHSDKAKCAQALIKTKATSKGSSRCSLQSALIFVTVQLAYCLSFFQ